MAATRRERMQERMRGAGRHKVEDATFSFNIPLTDVDETPKAEPLPPNTRSTPNTSAKRKRLDETGSVISVQGKKTLNLTADAVLAAASDPGPPLGTPKPSPPLDPYYLEPTPPEDGLPVQKKDVAPELKRSFERPPRVSGDGVSNSATVWTGRISGGLLPNKRIPKPVASPIVRRLSGIDVSELETETETETEQRPSSVATTVRTDECVNGSPQLSSGHIMGEEVVGSPADAPGSGQRRKVLLSQVTVDSGMVVQRVQRELDEETVTMTMTGTQHEVSSPLTRLSMRSATEHKKAAGQKNGEATKFDEGAAEGVVNVEGDVDDLGAEQTASFPNKKADDRARPQKTSPESHLDKLSPGGIADYILDHNTTESRSDSSPGEEREERSIAEQVPVINGETSPLPDQAGGPEEAQEVDGLKAARLVDRKRPLQSLAAPEPEPEEVVEDTPAAKRRRKEPAKPISAKQQQPTFKTKKQRKPETAAKAKSNSKSREVREEARQGPMTITVQRFTKQPRDEEDMLHAKSYGVNLIDVVAQTCQEQISVLTDQLAERSGCTEEAGRRRELRTKIRTLQDLGKGLQASFLGHAIMHDALHDLQKRFRDAQKQKIKLRDNILQLRAEREQVALRIEAVRTRHEREKDLALRKLSLSTCMHDVDMAVEIALAAPALDSVEQKGVDLANLEITISRIAEQALDGGSLRQVREFNAMLERAARVLEGRSG